MYVIYLGLCACLAVTEQFKLDIKCVESKYDRAVHTTVRVLKGSVLFGGLYTLLNLSIKFQMIFVHIERGFLLYHIRMF